MEVSRVLVLVLFFNACLYYSFVIASIDNERKPYIVYMGEIPEKTTTLMDEHHSLLSEAIGDEKTAREHKLHSFGRSFNGFVARMLPDEAKRLSQKEGVVSVFPNTVYKLQTTRSWDFIGMPEKTTKRNLKVESNLIIGLLDSGIWVDSPSFDDTGYGPPPAKWKGKCEKGVNFTGCNNKVIGAQTFNVAHLSVSQTPVDIEGHGTHTASTAAGVPLAQASLYGLAKGTARGGVPSARIAMYKICWIIWCQSVDLMAALDAAIGDGVDVLSISISSSVTRPFFEDPIAIGAFHALKKGILTSCAAGNDGPSLFSVGNVAPWILTVGASSIDRQFRTVVRLGDGTKIDGMSINTFSLKKNMYPLTNGAHAANLTYKPYGNPRICEDGTLSERKVHKRIVHCRGEGQKDTIINKYHGAGVVMSIDRMDLVNETAFPFVLPATPVGPQQGDVIDRYIKSSKSPTAVIYKSKIVNMTAPFVTTFSSRGPQKISPNILKPDLTAPGLNILAAYTNMTSLTGIESDSRVVKYNIMAGTSMSCPHASAAAAYVKSFHPNWSPAAIKSALMTTATPMRIKPNESELASGSGQINPTSAINPGLVYDITISSYIRYLCKEGYNDTQIYLLVSGKRLHNCSSLRMPKGVDGLNYPSMHMQLEDWNSTISGIFYRTVTNVGGSNATYMANVEVPNGLVVKVVPKILKFDRPNQKRAFRVKVKGRFLEDNSWLLSASLAWSDNVHSVKSPIVIYRGKH
ncbi:hypothetical protein LguiA_032386 [Lonicera macranthoides]